MQFRVLDQILIDSLQSIQSFVVILLTQTDIQFSLITINIYTTKRRILDIRDALKNKREKIHKLYDFFIKIWNKFSEELIENIVISSLLR